ncbi:MAG: ABC transporter ATP-binding protein/permease, partial [Chloroflexota bacterium]|nr:ABC transporter ATP-binding protein/permease [Chloroflexota bacterium]
VLSSVLLLVGIIILLFLEGTSIGVALTLFVIATLLILIKLRDVAVPHWKQSRAASAAYFGFVEERLAGMEELRAAGAKAYTLRRFFELLRTFWQTTVRARLLGFAMINTAWVLFSIGTAVAFVLGARLYAAGDLTLGTVYLIVHYTGMMAMPIQRILQEMEKFQQAGAGIARIQELRAITSKLVPPALPTTQTLGCGPLSVTFEGVSFAYEEAAADANAPEFVLHDLCFHLEAGQVLGLLGRTGSGKTTITRLLTRLYDPTLGCVQLDDVDVRHASLDQLRRRIGVVTQNVQLFHATVRDNVTFFDAHLRDDEIIAIIHELGLTRWYEALAHGLDTVLAADGGGLSAGEAQLLAFVRVFLKDPGLIILDEASSRLDPATEGLIERAVERLLRNRTAIVIAHRLATVQRADQIMILEGGRILEHDQRVRLATDPESRFYQLLQTGLAEVLA